MGKLELKHIAGYLPYKLRTIRVFYFEGEGNSWVDELEPHNINSLFNDPRKKPILRPLSDLTKEITVNGQTFIPMEELAKLEKGYTDDGVFYPDDELEGLLSIKRKASGATDAYIADWSTGLGSQREILNYNASNGFNAFYYFNVDMSDIVLRTLGNQALLFEKLDEWHIDWKYDLIGKGLAISIHDIKQ